MRARSDAGAGALELQALYSVATLARAAGVTQQLMLRALRAAGVDLLTVNRSILVPLVELEARAPLLWRSIVAAERIRADARAAAGGT
jgi:hypothetical protein